MSIYHMTVEINILLTVPARNNESGNKIIIINNTNQRMQTYFSINLNEQIESIADVLSWLKNYNLHYNVTLLAHTNELILMNNSIP
jgi:hypothetical protein